MPSLPAGPVDGALLTNELIHNSSEFAPAGGPATRWLADGVTYTALEMPEGADPSSTKVRAPAAWRRRPRPPPSPRPPPARIGGSD